MRFHFLFVCAFSFTSHGCGDQVPGPLGSNGNSDAGAADDGSAGQQPHIPDAQAIANDAGARASDCARYQERVADSCVPVTVTGIESRGLSFARNDYRLEGTLVVPLTQGRYLAPGIVLMHGSGPNDRNETTTANLGVSYGRPIETFRLLAEALAKQGAAVFQYDKRNCFQENSDGRCLRSIKDYPGYPASLDALSYEDFVLDAREAIHALAQAPGIRSDDLTIIGHSEGANYVPRILVDEPGTISGVSLAGASTAFDQSWVDQARDFAKYLEGLDAQGYAQQIASLREKADADEKNFKAMRAGTFSGSSYLGLTVDQWLSWMHGTDHLREEFLAVGKPMLLMNGSVDFNVAPRHLQTFESWASQGGMKVAQFKLLHNVTHSFVLLSPDGRQIVEDLSPEAVSALVQWHRELRIPDGTRSLM